jgi:hypothetical protein
VKNKELKEQLKKDILESVAVETPETSSLLAQMNKLVQLHQEVIQKLNTSSNKNLLNTVLEEITEQLDEIDEKLLEILNSAKAELNENMYGEGWMIKSQLYNIAKNAMRLYKIVGEKEDFEDWVQAKITIVDDYMATIAQFIEYRKMSVGDFDMDDKDQYKEKSEEDLSNYNDEIPLL